MNKRSTSMKSLWGQRDTSTDLPISPMDTNSQIMPPSPSAAPGSGMPPVIDTAYGQQSFMGPEPPKNLIVTISDSDSGEYSEAAMPYGYPRYMA